MLGSPGTILAARAAGFDSEAQRSAEILVEEWKRQEWGLWDHCLAGRQMQVIGPAHGFAGNVHVLRSFVDEGELRTRVERWREVARRFPQDQLARAALADNAASLAGAEDDPAALDLAIVTYESLLAEAIRPEQRFALESTIKALRKG